ncbi:hypothetical protein H6F77_25210 [Microcoleus sp. FACHB-831]|uniref:hypothetical protein n=1 Tax=Microcoleus sp. FACHB-831 TaxID=2692827 RepID=UPI0016855207|nr:hypothetical protein [Microcoleus sp. FACHB-831]MBD1924345.1 hypothetical protein [Microcoleus sp. FACHB-831]
MRLNLIERAGEWNPQMFREFKGQLKRRNILITGFGSFACQFILVGLCSESFIGASDNLEWEIRWQGLWQILNWMLPALLLVGGVYMIINDLAKEERRGTLNFVRLSPQSSQSILCGKALGVPILLYLAIALALPLHCISGLVAGIHLVAIAALYTLWGAACCLFYSAAILITLLGAAQGNNQALAPAGSSLALMLGLPYISFLSFIFDSPDWKYVVVGLHWFFLPIGFLPPLGYGWLVCTFSAATYWVWQAINRRFRNPNSTLISKKQSYLLVASFQLWLVGFVLPGLSSGELDPRISIGFAFLFAINPVMFLVLISALSPGRQALQDWTRYRKVESKNAKQKRNLSAVLGSSLVQDLIWAEKSPAVVAIAINLLICAVIWIPWILLLPQHEWNASFTIPKAILSLLLTSNIILILSAICSLMMLIKTQKQNLYASVALAAIFLPPLTLLSLSLTPEKSPLLWLFTAVPAIGLQHASMTAVFLGILSHWGIFALLTLQLTRQMRRIGASDTKALLAGNR